jgi:NAD(P)-dependent dehydrogenase (short-subunit alcohol dehydrogenase family)
MATKASFPDRALRFSGKVVLVTGATAGIGRAAVLLFAQEGAKLVVVGRRTDEGERTVAMIRERGAQATFVRADVTVADDCKHMVDEAVAFGGRLDVAFNNAGVVIEAELVDTEEAVWDQVLSVNAKSVFLSMKYEISAMMASGGGVILNNSSVQGLVAAPGVAAYCAAKHAVVGLTRAAALEYIRKGVRINAICPGITETDMMTEYLKDKGEGAVTELKEWQPMGRWASAEEMARSVLMLASEDASFMVGQAVAIDGGFTTK